MDEQQPKPVLDLEAEVAQLMAGPLPMPVVTEAEPPQLPYAKQYRVPEVLLDLEDAVARWLDIDPQRLILLEGAAAGGRKGGWFEIRRDVAVEWVVGYVIAYTTGDGRLTIAAKRTRFAAKERWSNVEHSISVIARAIHAAEVLSAEGSVTGANYLIDTGAVRDGRP